MTTYEIITLSISIVAILIPIIQWIWRKWVVKARLNHYHTGNGFIFINRSGSYIQIQSVFEAVNKPISIKNISLFIKRQRDNQQRNYIWSTFSSPVNMQFVGKYAFSTEIAHPFRIDANQVQCAFIEYGDRNQGAYKTLSPLFNALSKKAKECSMNNIPYAEAEKTYIASKEYKDAEKGMENEFFWIVDKYEATIIAEFAKEAKSFTLSFDVTSEQNSILQQNMKECLLAPLKELYFMPLTIQNVTVMLEDKQGNNDKRKAWE